VLVCGAILFAATTYDEGDAVLMSKVAKQGIVNGLKKELKAVKKPTDMGLAVALVKHVQVLSVHGLSNMIDNWKDEQMSDLDANPSPHGQMLVLVPSAITTSLEEDSALCSKKDMIFDKLNQLLKKLGHENVERNATDQAAYEAKQAALGAWLDGEANYRLEIEKEKEAEEGATFARGAYEKWKDTVDQTTARLDTMKASYPAKKASIASEREMIKTIMRYLGILDDQPVDATSAAAGGYMNPDIEHPNAPPAEKQISHQRLMQVKAEIAKLRNKAQAGDGVKLAMVNKLEAYSNKLQTKLASFAETDFIKNLLLQMLKDLDTREEVIDSALSDTETELASHKAKLVEYEKELVDLSNAQDKAAQRAAERNLERQNLNGQKINTEETYEDEHSEFTIVAPPSDKAIFVIQMIMKKISEHCAAPE